MSAVARNKGPAPVVLPKHSHYVSMNNDGIYPALSSPSGYEDEHPEEYRPASPLEIAKYKAGAESVFIEHVDLSESAAAPEPERATPATIKLADDDPEPVIPPGPAPVMSRTV